MTTANQERCDWLDRRVSELTEKYLPFARTLLEEVIRIPADYVDRTLEEGGDPECGLSNHEGQRLEHLRDRIIEIGAVEGPDDVGFDGFGNLWWIVEDPDDGVPASERTVVYLDGHSDTVRALRSRWIETIGGGIDAYLGMTDGDSVDREFLRQELGYLPPDDEWQHLVFGRGSADQLGGVVCQVIATKIARELRAEGALRGTTIVSYATVSEEDNDGGGPMFIMKEVLKARTSKRDGDTPPPPRPSAPELLPDVVILTEGTGCAAQGPVGLYRGQRGRMQIEVVVTGRSCHGSMPWEGKNPLEFGGTIIAEAAARYERGEGFLSHDFLGDGSRTASDVTLETPSNCAVPERFTFRFDRRLTVGESPEQAVADIEQLDSIGRAREAGLEIEVGVPEYRKPTWRGFVPGNAETYPGWITPAEHPCIEASLECYERAAELLSTTKIWGGRLAKKPRLARWVFSTDGVGYPIPNSSTEEWIPQQKQWVTSGDFTHPPMFGIGPGIEQNTHKIGECVDARELGLVIAFLARFPSLYRGSNGGSHG